MTDVIFIRYCLWKSALLITRLFLWCGDLGMRFFRYTASSILYLGRVLMGPWKVHGIFVEVLGIGRIDLYF